MADKALSSLDTLKQFPLLPSFTSRHLFVVCDGQGRVFELHDPGRFQYGLFLKELEETRDIKRFFDFGKLKDLSDMDAPSTVLNATPRFSLREHLIEFHTSLTAASLRVTPAANGRFLGVISFAAFLPNVSPMGKNGFVYIDGDDRLRGFDPHFFLLFNRQFESPAEMLDQPAVRFFSPSPAEIQRQRIPAFDLREVADYKTLCDIDCTSPAAKNAFDTFGDSELRGTEEGLLWTSRDPLLSYLILQAPSDLDRRDFSLTWEADTLAGEPPVAVVSGLPGGGTEEIQRHNVLSGGILAGAQGVAPGARVIKKAGVILKSAAAAAQLLKSQRLVKKGESFFYFQDDKEVLSWYDMDFHPRETAVAALAMRQGGRCLLRRVRLAARESAAPFRGAGDNIIVRLKDAAGSHFVLSSFHNAGLTSSHPGVAGYYLQNVTDLQERMNRLDAQYRTELRKRERLEILNKESRGERQDFFGTSAKITAIKETARVAAASQATVLIEGPTGTGKEVLARFIHAHSPRKQGPFVKVDCTTLPRELMESELFGHEKGAFTGAVDRKTGRFEMAAGGTLFLDEVSNLTREAQAKLLQFLQDFTIQRVGGNAPVRLEVRVIAASNVTLASLVKNGAFREDLYFRLCVVVFKLPPLSERRDDLLDLCNHFLDIFNEAEKKRIARISAGALRKIYEYPWPGNIRELKNAIHRAVLFCGESEIGEADIVLEHSPGSARETGAAAPKYHRLRGLEEAQVLALLEKHGGVLRRVARELGVTQRALYYYLDRKQWDPDRFRAGRRPSAG